LQIPKLRTGSYLPSFLEPRRRAEQALVAVVQEAYVNGVSTRKVDRLVEQMGLRGVSKDQVSRMCRALDEQVELFRNRPLDGEYPDLWLDAKVEKVRERGGVRQKALVIAYAVHESGVREVLGIDVGEAETEAFWTEFLFSLKARGLRGVRLCVSDAHQGLVSAIARVLGCRWQRCTVHFLRDMLGHCGRSQQPMIATAIRQIFNADTGQEAPNAWPTSSTGSRRRHRKSPDSSSKPRRSCSPSMTFRVSTGPSCAPRIRWSESTRRSAVAPMWSGSIPTIGP
jgi:transposase-like protein